jgi:hypothetical protein
MDAAETNITNLQAAVAAPLTTAAAGDDSVAAATTDFVHRNSGGFVDVDASGAGNIALTSDQWGVSVIILTGARTANGNVIFPTRGDRWLVVNLTTGAYAMTCKTAAGSGVKVAQGRSKGVYCDGTSILDEQTDISIRPRMVSSATTLAAGDDVLVDFSGGLFALTLPAAPQAGDQCRVRGNFLTSNLTVLHNGNPIMDSTGTASSTDYVANRNNLSAVFTWFVPAVGTAAWLVTLG